MVVIISIICIYRQSTIIQTQNNVKKLSDNEIKNMNHIWLYWETPPGKTRPTYIDLCYDTIKKHCSKNFKVHLLDEKSVYTYLPKLRRDINNLRIPQKADYIRLALLKKYGGIWLDSDIIVFSDLIDYINNNADEGELIKINIDGYIYEIPNYLIHKKIPNKFTKLIIRKSLYFTRQVMQNKFFIPNNLLFPKSRIILENYFN